MNPWTITGAALLGAWHPVANSKRGKKNHRVLVGSSIGVLTCFYGATKLEYLNILRGKMPRTLSPAGALYLGGFYSVGALSSMGVSLSAALLAQGAASLRQLSLPPSSFS